MTARTAAVARENQQIEESQGRAIAAREAEGRPRNALEAMSAKLEISPANLKKTLLNTVFSECKNDEQFMALIVVSNTFGLNPLLKEIYAFPAKGGGIVPMVSVDGWIRLMNEHPAFDGIEFEYTLDSKGATVAIEAIIYRSDRTHPVKVMEFMEECKGTTGPWQKSPRRMLRHRALIQGVRIAFGFSGIAAEGEEEMIDGGTITAQSLPSRQSLAEELGDEIPTNFDKQTGEIIDQQRGMTEVDEETARELDARTGNDGTLSDDNPAAAEGPADEDRGEGHTDAPAWLAPVRDIRERLGKAATVKAVTTIEQDWLNRVRVMVEDDAQVRSVESDIAAKKREISAGGEG